MVQYELRRLTRGTGRPIPEIEPEALKRLQAYDFPNNVEELFFLIDNAYRNMEPGGSITSDLLWTAQSVQKLDLFKAMIADLGFRGTFALGSLCRQLKIVLRKIQAF